MSTRAFFTASNFVRLNNRFEFSHLFLLRCRTVVWCMVDSFGVNPSNNLRMHSGPFPADHGSFAKAEIDCAGCAFQLELVRVGKARWCVAHGIALRGRVEAVSFAMPAGSAANGEITYSGYAEMPCSCRSMP